MTSNESNDAHVAQAKPLDESYTEMFLKRLAGTSNQEMIMKESLEGVDLEVDGELTSVEHIEICDKKWIFKLHSARILKAVMLLHDSHRNNFLLNRITATTNKNKEILMDEEPVNAQEWISKFVGSNGDQLTYEIEVIFFTKCYGTFSQHILFYFGQEPALAKKLQVDVTLDKDLGQIKEMLKKFGFSSTERWTNSNALIIHSLPTSENNLTDRDEALTKYFAPDEHSFLISESIDDDDATIDNYRSRMHQLLYIEEMTCYEQLAKYNAPATVQIVHSLPCISGANTEKFSITGELFAIIFFDENISEDSPAGRLLLNNCTTVLIGDSKKVSKKKLKNRHPNVYETVIEDVGRNFVYLRLSAKTVTNLKLEAKDKSICDKKLEIQFQLNRSLFCKWHQAIDNISNLEIIFPDMLRVIKSPNFNKKKWTRKWTDDDSKLSDKQKEAITAITLPRNSTLPPVLIIGAFGTGKTYTLAQAIRHILLEKDSKILICTCSNSAADLYVEEYLHSYVKSGIKEATPLRIYHHEHRVPILHSTVLEYCLIEVQNDRKTFKIPTTEDILNHRVIVSTLNVISYLSNIALPAGHFTHILIDEAAQALECETLMALAFANKKTRIVLAGDLVQSTPEVFSSFAREKKFHISLLQRLHEKYPSAYPRIILSENYRSHKAIVEFTSNVFYNKELISVAEQPDHHKFYPLNFFSVAGKDVQMRSGFRNSDEVEELVKRVIELKKNWHSSWGEFNEHFIAVLTPYQDQTDFIRLELMKYKLSNIVVENISNVQGKQFRVVFLSTVRTGFTCTSETKSKKASLKDYGFLSNEKLLITALTRSQSLVAVVGDPVSLCMFGRSRHIWRKFIDVCSVNHGLHGIKLQELKNHLWDIDQRKTAAANPPHLPYPQATITTALGSPLFRTPANSSFYPPIIQTPFVPTPIMPTNQTAPRPMMDFVPQFQPNSVVYPHQNNMPFAGVGFFPTVTPFPQFPSFMVSPGFNSFRNGVNSVPPNSTSITLSQSGLPNFQANLNPAETLYQSPDVNLSAGDGVSAMQNRIHKNEMQNISNLRTIEIDNSLPKLIDRMEPKGQEQCDELLAKAIISSGSPLTMVENQYFKSFLQKLRPSYDILNEESLRKTHLDREFNEMNAHLKEILKVVRNIGIRIDSWNYLRNEDIINVILTLPEPILYKCIRITENQHTEEHTMEIVSHIIKEIGPERVFAVICHNASNARKSEEIISTKFTHITTMPCLARILDSIITFVLEKCSTMRTIREQCFKIVDVITKSTIWYPIFTRIKKDDPTRYKSALVVPVATRLETLIKCFESIMQNKSVLQTLMKSESVQNVIEDTKLTSSGNEFWNFLNDVIHFRSLLLGDAFWNRLNSTYNILKPIVKWILKLEEGECRISDAADVFNEIENCLKIFETNPNTCIPIEEGNAIIEYFDKRRKQALGGIHFAAYFLNPANIMDYEKLDSVMSAEEISAAFRFIHNMSRHELFNAQSQKIINEMGQYRTKVGPWKDDFLWENVNCQDFDPICWWKTFCSHTELSKIATRILELPVTSAATDRSFSEISMKRNSLCGDDAAKVTYIAHNMKLMAQTKSKYEKSQLELIENVEDDEFFDAEVADWEALVTSNNTHQVEIDNESELNSLKERHIGDSD